VHQIFHRARPLGFRVPCEDQWWASYLQPGQVSRWPRCWTGTPARCAPGVCVCVCVCVLRWPRCWTDTPARCVRACVCVCARARVICILGTQGPRSCICMYVCMYTPGRTWTQGPRSLSSARGSCHMRRSLSLARRRGALVPLPGFSLSWVSFSSSGLGAVHASYCRNCLAVYRCSLSLSL